MGRPKIDHAELKEWVVAIVSDVSPEDTFVVESGFDELLEHWASAHSQDEGRFIGGPEVAHFAAIVGPFLLGFLTDVTKDVAKDQAKKLVTRLIDKIRSRQATTEDRAALSSALNEAVAKSRYSKAQKEVLFEGFNKLLKKADASKKG